jgi:hypothetical protein
MISILLWWHDHQRNDMSIMTIMPSINLVEILVGSRQRYVLHSWIESAYKDLCMLDCAFVWLRIEDFQKPHLACVGVVNLKDSFVFFCLCDLALSCGDYSSPWLIDPLISHDLVLLSPQSIMSLFIYLLLSRINTCRSWKREIAYKLDKGFSLSIFLDQVMVSILE